MSSPAAFWRWLDRLFCDPVPAARLGAVRALLCAVALYDVLLYAPVVFMDAANVSSGIAGRPWTPIYLFQVLGVPPIGSEAAELAWTIAVIALTGGILGIASRLSCAIGALAFFYWTGLAYSFGKPHHDKVALAFGMAALPFARVGLGCSVDALVVRWLWRRRDLPASPAVVTTSALPIRITQFTIALGYAGAGFGKLILGGLDWFNGYTLQGIMLGHDGDWSRAVGSSVALCQFQSIGTVFVQATFPLVIFWPRARWFYLPAVTAFHLMTWKTMDTGPYMRLWLLLWVFTPLERVPLLFWHMLRRRPLIGGLLAVAAAAYLALVAYVANNVVPWWALLALFAVVALAIARSGNSPDQPPGPERRNVEGGLADPAREP
ncbi:MAG: hypothetical protein NXI31_05250 [bacterium]|nr:hypothetical protein [bacterium]